MGYTLLKNKEIGSIVKLNEYGSPIEFKIKQHDYESELNGTGRTLLVRVDCAEKVKWANSMLNIYASGNLDTWFNETYSARLDSNILNAIGTTKFYYTPGNGTTGVYTLERAIFALSVTELGLTHTYANKEGSPLPNAADIQVAYMDGDVCNQATRTPVKTGKVNVFGVGQTGLYQTTSDSSLGARPCFTLPGTAVVLDDGTVVIDVPPTISGADGDLGTFSTSAPSVAYTVTDEDGDAVSVTIKLDGVVKNTHTVTLGQKNTWQLTGVDWLKVLNGAHTITISADDGYVQSERTYTFTKSVTSMSFTLSEPLPADDMITKAIESIVGVIPANATTKIEVCNNAYDDSPTWQDVTPKVLAGEKFQLTNTTKTADNWGYNVRVTVSRGSAIGDIYINSMGGFFE